MSLSLASVPFARKVLLTVELPSVRFVAFSMLSLPFTVRFTRLPKNVFVAIAIEPLNLIRVLFALMSA